MLNLKLPTDPRWANIAEKNIDEILTDHAYCEQKAASSAISLIVNFPEYPEIVKALSDIAIEEMQHFRMVHKKIIERDMELGRERKDDYVNRLNKFFEKSPKREIRLVQRLLLSAMIEARSCERFKVLSENIEDEDLSKFYFDLMKSEARHYRVFLDFAKEVGEGIIDVEELWNRFLDYEAEVIISFGKKEYIHG